MPRLRSSRPRPNALGEVGDGTSILIVLDLFGLLNSSTLSSGDASNVNAIALSPHVDHKFFSNVGTKGVCDEMNREFFWKRPRKFKSHKST
jgi:hypothetical protein